MALPSNPRESTGPLPVGDQLPGVLTPLIGRGTQLGDVRSRLHGHRLVTLTGMGGVGKSRLALAVARAVESEGRRAIWVDLASFAVETEPGDGGGHRLGDDVAAAVAAAVCGQADPHRPPKDRLVRALGDQELLIVLDGCDRVLGGCRDLVTSLLPTCPGVRVLATSREFLGVAGELTWPVPGLQVRLPVQLPVGLPVGPPVGPPVGTDVGADQDGAVRLFLDRASEANPAWVADPDALHVVARICRRLEGLPLAIELAAARLRVLGVEQIADGLDDCLRMLAAPGAQVAERHRTLQATLDFSHDRLPPAEAAVFRTLAVFPVGATLDALSAVAGGDDVLDPLTRLVERSLVQVQPEGASVRFRLPEAVRQYAAVKLDRSGETAQRRSRQVAWCLELAEAGSRVQTCAETAAWLDRVEVEFGNLRQALSWAGQEASTASPVGSPVGSPGGSPVMSPVVGLRLVGRLWRFCWLRGRYGEGRYWTTRALRAGVESVEPAVLARVLHGAGVLAFLQCDYDEALERLNQALVSYPENDPAVAEVLRSLAGIARERGDYDGAVKLLGQVRSQANARADGAGAARCDLALSLNAWLRADVETARSSAVGALTAYRRLDDAAGATEAGLLIGLAELSDGNREPAVALLTAALAEGRRQGAREVEAYALHGLGAAARLGGDPAGATRLLRESLAIHHDLADRWRSASVLDDLAHCALAAGDGAEAARLLGAADAARAAIGVPVPAAERRARDQLVRAVESTAGGRAFFAGLAPGGLQGLDRVIEDCLRPAPLLLVEPVDRRRPAVAVRGEDAEAAGAGTAAELSVRALGGSRIRLGDQTIEARAWGYAKPRELLHFLLSGAPVGKDEIGLALWPEADSAALRGAFHTTLNRLRRVLGPDRVVYRGNRYSIDRSLPLVHDVETFRNALHEAGASGDPVGRERKLRVAVQTYRGDYLPGEPVGEWASALREQLQRSAERALLELGRLLLERDAPAAAVPVYRRALELDPLLEAAHRGLMHCHAGLGEPARALRQFAELRQVLRDEIDTDPAPGTAALAHRIRARAAAPGAGR